MAATAADLPARTAPPPPPPVFVVADMWTGFYAGLSAGYTWDASSGRLVVIPGESGVGFSNGGGFIGGAFIGYNRQLDANWLVGVEADFSLMDRGRAGRRSFTDTTPGDIIDGGNGGGPPPPPGSVLCVKVNNPDIIRVFKNGCPSSTNDKENWAPHEPPQGGMSTVMFNGNGYYRDQLTTITSYRMSTSIDNLATIRGRLGFLATPGFLLYATGGLAFGDTSARLRVSQSASLARVNCGGGSSISNCANPMANQPVDLGTQTSSADYSDWRVGWVLGAGVEWKLATNWTVRGEYAYYNLGTKTLRGNEMTFFGSDGIGSAITPSARVKFDGHIVRVGLAYQFVSGSPTPIAEAISVRY
jgi:outer membrane immunogenic protein